MDASVAVLVDAKREYSKQLIQTIRSHLLSGVLSIYDEAFSVCEENKEPDLAMLTFQELLGEVPKWNSVMIADETNRIVDESQCDFLEDLLTAVFVCHTKILTTVRVTNKDRKINLKVPSVENFVHQVYIEMAREFWKHPYLLNPMDVSKLEYQQNLRKAENIIHDCLESTVRKLLPVKDILKEYLKEDHDGVDTATDDAADGAAEDAVEDAADGAAAGANSVQTGGADAESYKETLKKEIGELKQSAQSAGVTFESASPPSIDTTATTDAAAAADTPSSPTKSVFDKIVDAFESKPQTAGGSADEVKTVGIGKGASYGGTDADAASGGASPSPSPSPSPSTSSSSSSPETKSVAIGGGAGSTSPLTPLTTLSSSPLASPASASSTTTPPLFSSPSPSPSSLSSPSSTSTPPSSLASLCGDTSPGSGSTELNLDSLLGGGSSDSGMEVVNVDFGGGSAPSPAPAPVQTNSSAMARFNTGSSSPSSPSSPSSEYSFF